MDAAHAMAQVEEFRSLTELLLRSALQRKLDASADVQACEALLTAIARHLDELRRQRDE